jgi:rRNA maturation endonuclease Nob1
MPDHEKVMSWLEGLTDDDWRRYHSDSEVRNIAKAALELLKEQEAVPVVQREIMHMLVWCCGSCGVAITEGDKFCRMCGRPVKRE